MQKTKQAIMHWIRVNRTEERLSEQVYYNNPFGSPIKLSNCEHNFTHRTDDVRVKCGELSFSCDRKELTMWK